MVSTINDPDKLTKEQQDIIVAAMEDQGRFQIANRADTRGKAIRTKKAKFFSADDPEVARHYIKCVKELELLLFVRECDKRDHYELTNFGWLIGRKLKQDRKQAASTAAETAPPTEKPA